jgi:alanyl-tRNA synthetase
VKCEVSEISLTEAKKTGVTILEGTKYGERVRVVDFKGVTADLCGGTHVQNTADLQSIILTKIEKKGSGTFRITGTAGEENVNNLRIELAHEMKAKVEDEIGKLRTVVENAELSELVKKAIARLEHEPAEVVLKETKTAVENLNKKLQLEIENQMLDLADKDDKYNVVIFNNINKKFLSKVIKELTSKLNDRIVVIQNDNKDNANVAFVLGNNVDQDNFAKILKESVSAMETIRGGGGRQLHQYGGPREDMVKLILDIESKI